MENRGMDRPVVREKADFDTDEHSPRLFANRRTVCFTMLRSFDADSN